MLLPSSWFFPWHRVRLRVAFGSRAKPVDAEHLQRALAAESGDPEET